MTNPVIEAVRRSLVRTEGNPPRPRPDIYPPRQPGTPETEIDLLLAEIIKLSGVGQRLAPAGLGEALSTLVAEQNVRKATLWDTPLLEQMKIAECLRSLGVELVSPNADKRTLALCDLGVTEADYALPETGTIVLRSSREKPRAVSLLPRIHLAVILPSALRADLHQVFAEAKDSPYLVFITGPSRTADIELTTTLGVHGPRNLYVWLLEGGYVNFGHQTISPPVPTAGCPPPPPGGAVE
jgi:L-lactate dehydrogenase complex protein LldG